MQDAPASVPAVLEKPMTTPAWRGAMSMWLTEKPPRASPAKPRQVLMPSRPALTLPASGSSSSAAAAPQNPAHGRVCAQLPRMRHGSLAPWPWTVGLAAAGPCLCACVFCHAHHAMLMGPGERDFGKHGKGQQCIDMHLLRHNTTLSSTNYDLESALYCRVRCAEAVKGAHRGC